AGMSSASFEGLAPTEFVGYETLEEDVRVIGIYENGTEVESIKSGVPAIIVLDRTPFYAESGGQIGDQGELSFANGKFAVNDTQKVQANVFGHHGVLKSGELKRGDIVRASVDVVLRKRSAWNHSATHLLHSALRKVLGIHVTQKGSLVDSNRTRFDFS